VGQTFRSAPDDCARHWWARNGWLLLLAAVSAPAATKPPTLTVAHFAVQQYEDGPPYLKPDAFSSGQIVNFSFFAEGFTRKGDHVSVSFEGHAADPAGVPLCPPITGKVDTNLTDEDKDWVPKLRGNFALPALLLPGAYKLSVQAKDELSGATASGELEFLVSGPKIQPSPVLAIRNLKFYRNDEDEKPLETAAYRVTEEIHARFFVVGFQNAEKGAIDVTYGVALSDSAGHVLFQEPAAARDNGAEFYPKPYVPGSMAFTLKQGTPPGEFTITITAKDAIGNQTADAHGTFRLE
jgi:hypothetical protein